MLISGICGSLRNESWNKLLLKIFLEKISDNSNFETDVIDVFNIEVPIELTIIRNLYLINVYNILYHLPFVK